MTVELKILKENVNPQLLIVYKCIYRENESGGKSIKGHFEAEG